MAVGVGGGGSCSAGAGAANAQERWTTAEWQDQNKGIEIMF